MNILVTAGPNREHIDAIRFITSASSGRMGYAIAREAQRAGHHVTLISGPTSLEPPPNVSFTAVTSAREMRDAVMSEFPNTDCVIMTAAVSDYRPIETRDGKLKKDAEELTLKLVRNPDILLKLGQKKRDDQILVGFSLEVQDPLKNALDKLRDKNLDYIVLNDQTSLGASRATVKIIGKDSAITEIEDASKDVIAGQLIETVSGLRANATPATATEHSKGSESVDIESLSEIRDSQGESSLKVQLRIKQKDSCKDLPLPKYMSTGASGMDLYAAVEETVLLKPGDIELIPTGIHIALPRGYEAQVRPRSGFALRHGVTIVNSPGTIDSDYRNEIGVILTNLGRQPVEIERGMRIAQLIIAPVAHAEISQVEELDATERNLGGFGSTGIGIVDSDV